MPKAFAGQRAAIEGAEILRYLPDSTIGAVVVRSPKTLESALSANDIFSEYREPYVEVVAQLTKIAGSNLLKPENLGSIGIDAEKPAGMAVLLKTREMVVFFATLNDPLLFQKSIERVVPTLNIGQLVVQPGKAVTILRLQRDPEIACVIAGTTAMLIVSNRLKDREALLAWLRNGSEPSLAESGRVKRSFQGLNFGEDAAGFLALDSLIDSIASQSNDEDDNYFLTKANRLETEIETAKSEGAGQNRIDTLETELEKTLQWHEEQQLRRSTEEQLFAQIFAPLGTLAIGIDLDGPQSRLHLQVQALQGSLPARLLARPSRPITLPSRLGAQPLLLLAGHTQPSAMNELLNLALRADGVTRKGAFKEIQTETGLDLEEGIALLEGELGGAITLNKENLIGNSEQKAVENSIGMHLLARVRDPGRAQDYLNAAAKLPDFSKFAKQEAKGATLMVPGPWGNRLIRIEVIDEFLQAKSVDDEAAVAWLPSEAERLADEHSSALFSFDPVLFTWMTMSSFRRYRDYGMHQHSASDKKPDRYQEILKRQAIVREKLHELELQSILGQGKLVGRLTVSAQVRSDRLSIIGGLFGEAANLGRSAQSYIESLEPELQGLRLDTTSEFLKLRLELDKLREERWDLERVSVQAPLPAPVGRIVPADHLMVLVGPQSNMLVKQTIHKRLPTLLPCYTKLLLTRSSLVGQLVLKFEINSKGRVKKAQIANSTLHDIVLQKCLLKTLRKTRFPASKKGSTTTVTYPLNFLN